jgi:hypothetical protein
VTSFPVSTKKPIVALQWLVAIAPSYLVIAIHDWNITDPNPALLILTGLISAVALSAHSEEAS